MIKTLLKLIFYIPLFIVGAIALVVGCTLENMTGLYRDKRLKFPARFRWYILHIPPKTCQDCGEELIKCGYEHKRRYRCRRCDKDWANVGGF